MRQSRSRVRLENPSGRRDRPLGEVTRGKTRANRLRAVDAFVLRYAEALIRREDGEYAGAWNVDLGYGAEPTTTLDMARSLRRVNPLARVLGVEIDADRVAAALPYVDELTDFRLGGFNLPLSNETGGGPERARLVRALNVLRQYEEESVLPAWNQMGAALLEGGLLVEGTSDPLGRLWVVNLLRRGPGSNLEHEALVFGASLKVEFDPSALQSVLPKNLIHRVVPGEPIYVFFEQWKRAALATSAQKALGRRQWVSAAAEHLAQSLDIEGWRIDTRRRWLRTGTLVVKTNGLKQV